MEDKKKTWNQLNDEVKELKQKLVNEHNVALQLSNANEQLKKKIQELYSALQEANKEEYYTNLNLACRVIENKNNYSPSVLKKMEQVMDDHIALLEKLEKLQEEARKKAEQEKAQIKEEEKEV